MNLPISQALLETVFENTFSFMGVYNVDKHEFEFINQTGLEMLNIAD